MALHIESLFALEGPNIVSFQPAVLISLRSSEPIGDWFVTRLKALAQRVGLVIGFVELNSQELSGDWRIKLECVTPQPAFVCAIAELLVREYQAEQSDDESWDSEEAIYQLQRKRRQERIPLPILQLQASCLQYHLPLLDLGDGRWQIGLGKNSFQFDQAQVLQNPAFQPDWQALGLIPIAVWLGDHARAHALNRLQSLFAQAQPAIQLVDQFNHTLARQVFADQKLEQALVGLEVASILRQGLPFEQSWFCAILDLPDPAPFCIDPAMWFDSAGLALALNTAPDALAVIYADDARTLALADYATCECVFVSTGSQQGLAAIATRREQGGRALFVRDGALYRAQGEHEEHLGDLSGAAPEEQLALLSIYLYLEHAGFADLKAALF